MELSKAHENHIKRPRELLPLMIRLSSHSLKVIPKLVAPFAKAEQHRKAAVEVKTNSNQNKGYSESYKGPSQNHFRKLPLT